MNNKRELAEINEKKDLFLLLKEKTAKISLNDIIEASLFLQEDAKYVQRGYREKFIESYIKGFLTRITDIKDDTNEYKGLVDKKELQNALDLLVEQEDQLISNNFFCPSFFKIYKIISIYTTFIREEPVHQVGTPFPGGFEVKYENGKFLCPVKEKQKDNPGAVCGFCIAEQDERV